MLEITELEDEPLVSRLGGGTVLHHHPATRILEMPSGLYWALIGGHWSCDTDPELWLAETVNTAPWLAARGPAADTLLTSEWWRYSSVWLLAVIALAAHRRQRQGKNVHFSFVKLMSRVPQCWSLDTVTGDEYTILHVEDTYTFCTFKQVVSTWN